MNETKLIQEKLCEICQSMTKKPLEVKIDNLIKLIKELADKYKIEDYEELISKAMDG